MDKKLSIEWRKFSSIDEDIKRKIDFSKYYNYFVFNQKNINMCMVTSFLTILEYLLQIKGLNYLIFSRNYMYFNCREIKNKLNENTYLGMLEITKSVNLYGLKCTNGEEADTNYHDIFDEDFNFSTIICQKIPLKIKNIKRKLNYAPILVLIKTANENLHAVCFVGYNDDKKYFKYQNSFGVEWNNKGFGKIYYNEVNEKIVKAVSFDIL